MSDTALPTTEPSGAPEKGADRSWVRTPLLVAMWTVFAVVALGVLALAALRTDAGRNWTKGLVLQQISNLLAEDATIGIESIDGNLLSGATITGVTVDRFGRTILRVDTLEANYNLWTLWDRTFSADHVALFGASLVVHQLPDSSFTTTGLFRERAPKDSTTEPFTVLLSEAVVRRGHAEIHWLNASRDSVLAVDSLSARVRDFASSGDELGGTIDELALVAVAPFDASRLRLATSGTFSRERLALRSLSVSSTSGTQIDGRATVDFVKDALPVFDANIAARPLALEDVRAFAGLSLFGSPTLAFTAESDGGLLSMDVNAGLGDAALSLNGTLSRETDGPVRYRAEGSLRNLNPANITRKPAQAANLTGDFSLSLEGSELKTLTGPFRLALRESRFGERLINRVVVDGTASNGLFAADIEADIPGADLVAGARIRPFGGTPSYEVRGRAKEIDLARLLPGTVRRESFAGDFAIVGEGTSLKTFDGTVAVSLDRAVLPTQTRTFVLDASELDGTLSGGVLDFDADVRLARNGGRAIGSGSIDLLARPIPLLVRSARAENLDLGNLLTNPALESRLNGTFSLKSDGLAVTEDRFEIVAQLTPSSYRTTRIEAADVKLILDNGIMHIDVDANLGAGGELTALGTVSLFVQPQRYDLEGRVVSIDLEAFTGKPSQNSDLTGRYTLSGRGFDARSLVAEARIQLENSRYGERLLNGTDVSVNLSSGRLAILGEVETPEGFADLDVTGNLFSSERSFSFGSGTRFRNVDLSSFAPGQTMRTSLSGTFQGTINGLGDLTTANGSGVLTLDRSRLNEADIRSGRIAFDLSRGALGATADVTIEPGIDSTGVELPAGRFVAAIQGRPFDDVPSLSVRGRAESLDVGAMLDLTADVPAFVSGTFDLSADGFELATMDLSGSVRGGPSQVGPVRVDTLITRFALSSGVLDVDTLALISDVANVVGSGTIAAFNVDSASDFHLRGTVASLAPLGDLIGRPISVADASFDLAALGAPGELMSIRGTLAADRLEIDSVRVRELDGELDLLVDRARLDSLGARAIRGDISARFGLVLTENQRVESGSLAAHIEDAQITLDGAARFSDERDFDFFASVETGTTPASFLIERGRLTLGASTWRVKQPARLALNNGMDVRGLLLTTDDTRQQIAADGHVSYDGEQNFLVTIDGLEIGSFSEIIGLSGIKGAMTGALELTGTAEAPVLSGDVGVANLATGDDRVGSLRSSITYDDGKLGLDATLTHANGKQLKVNGFIPQRFSLLGGFQTIEPDAAERVRLTARADSFPVAWAAPIIERTFGYTNLDGQLTLDLNVGGTQGDPRVDGVASVRGGQIGVPATGLIYSPILADMTLEGNQLKLDDVRIERSDGSRSVDVTGDITLRELSLGEFNLTITPNRFLAMDTRTYDGVVLEAGSTPLRLTGTILEPVLRGSVVLAQGDIRVTDELISQDLEPITLTRDQIEEVEQRFGRNISRRDTADSRFIEALDYDLTVQIRRDVWIRSSSASLPFDIEFSGDVRARKTPFAENSQLYGTIELERGSLSTLNRRFEVSDGTLTFNGPALGAVVALGAQLDIRLPGSVAGQTSATVKLTVTGQLNENPEIRLTSDPVMDPTDIVSLIATGQLSDQLVGGGAISGAISGAAFGQLSGIADRIVNQLPGLDLVQIDVDENGEVVIRLGKYLTNRLFVTVGQTVNSSTQTDRQTGRTLLTLDFQLQRWLKLESEARLGNGTPDIGGGLSAETAW